MDTGLISSCFDNRSVWHNEAQRSWAKSWWALKPTFLSHATNIAKNPLICPNRFTHNYIYPVLPSVLHHLKINLPLL